MWRRPGVRGGSGHVEAAVSSLGFLAPLLSRANRQVSQVKSGL